MPEEHHISLTLRRVPADVPRPQPIEGLTVLHAAGFSNHILITEGRFASGLSDKLEHYRKWPVSTQAKRINGKKGNRAAI